MVAEVERTGVRKLIVTLTIVLLVSAVSAGASAARSGPVTGSSETVTTPLAGLAAKPSRAERRCRLLARRRLARSRELAHGSVRTAARARVRRKLRRCLREARSDGQTPGPLPGEPAPPTPGQGGGPSTPGSPPTPLASFTGVTASDSDGFRLTLSRPLVAAGDVTIELRNADSGPHDLVVRPEAGGPEAARFGPADPEAVVRKRVALARGRWYLFCSLSGHEAAGMHVTLRAE